MQLRPYQQYAIERSREALVRNPCVLLQAPTGSGKTAIAAWMCQKATARGRRAYFLCHRQELVMQTAGTFAKVEG